MPCRVRVVICAVAQLYEIRSITNIARKLKWNDIGLQGDPESGCESLV